MTSNEDFLFAQEATAAGFVTDAQVQEALDLQRKLAEDLRLDERLSVLLVKRGYLAEEQARRVYAKLRPEKGGPGQIHGYRLLEVLGRGAMGTVYRAMHLGLQREVAVKVLRADLAGDRTQVERLKAEAAMLASLDHDNIVRALDAGVSNGFPYVVMELVEGETLRDRLRRDGRVPEDEALRITRGIADALERARRMGVVHRDVKPGNILLATSGVPKLMDLGLAKGPVDLGLTQHGATVGTPQYISPEQALDPRRADTRSDIYSLGATLYAMLAGRPPFDGSTLAEVLTKVLYEVPLPVRTLAPDVSPETGYLVERMMLRDPALRYRTPADVVADIDRLEQGTSILPKGFAGNWEAFLVRRQVRRRTLLAVGGVAAGALVAVGVKVGVDWSANRRVRDAAHERIELARRVEGPVDSLAAVDRRVALLETLQADARRYRSPAETALALELVRWREEQARGRVLRETLETQVRGPWNDGRFQEAYTPLHRFLDGTKDVAAREAKSALDRLVSESDAALGRDVRARFPVSVRDADDLAERLDAYASDLVRTYAPSAAREQAAERADRARVAATRLRAIVQSSLEAADDDLLESLVAAKRFGEALRRIEAGRAATAAVVAERGGALSEGEPPYVTAAVLGAVVSEPFDRRLRALHDLVEAVAVETRDRAYASWKDGDIDEAVARLDAFAEAASVETPLGVAFAAHALEARTLRDEILARAEASRTEAHRALAELVRDVLAALAADDVAAAKARIEEARADVERLRPVASGVDEVARVPAALAALDDGVFEGLAARVGREPSKWLPTLRFKDGREAERAIEVLSVDRQARTFDYQTHKGGGNQPPVRGVPVRALSDEDSMTLAGLDARGAEAAWLRGVIALLRLRPDDPDLYAPLRALEGAIQDFRLAGAAGASPLAARADELYRAQAALVATNEQIAQSHLDSGRRFMGEGRTGYPKAFYHFRVLVNADEEPTLRLPRTKVATEHESYVRKQLQRLAQEFKVSAVEQAYPSARVRNLSIGPGPLEVDALFDFEDDTPLKASFVEGLARVEIAPIDPERVMTPGVAGNRALRLLPGVGREVVRDRPLALASYFLPGTPRSVEFVYYPESPFALAIDLDGVAVCILSDDPLNLPLGPGTPRLPDETSPPKYDVYGHGRGIVFRASPSFTDPTRWREWGDAHHGRHFVPPMSSAVKRDLSTRFFAFKAQDRPYRVRFVVDPAVGAELWVDDVLRATDRSEAVRTATPSRRIQILSLTSCLIDDLRVRGRVDEAALASRKPGPTGDGGSEGLPPPR